MAFTITSDVQVRRDPDGRVRQLSHSQQPYRPDSIDVAGRRAFVAGLTAAAMTPRSLAEQYLRDVAPVFEFAAAATANFAAALTATPSPANAELRFKEEKSVANSTTVSYDQTILGLPIWNAGVTVRIDMAPLQVTGSHNATHYGVTVQPPAPHAAYLPHLMDVDKVKQVLGLGATATPNINATRLLVYCYNPDERYDPQIMAHRRNDGSAGLAGPTPVAFPTLDLPAVPGNIEANRHYVVTEVLFSLPHPDWGPLNWRAFVEPETGAVLYLRALVSCARGAVFVTDPITSTGVLHSATSPDAALDAIRTTIPLLGLGVSAPLGSPQELRGEFIRLTDVENPPDTMPIEDPPYDFIYSSKSKNFAACNAYHHCDAVFRMIQGMGIDLNSYFNNTDFPVPVDPHARQGQVNAAAHGNTMGNGLGQLVFGVAKAGQFLGIAADVRVVLHEFGHALLWDHVNSPNFGFAHSPGDSLAAILHDPDSRAPDRFETFPFMKASAGLSRRHDRDVAEGWAWGGTLDDTQYGSEQILSTTLFRVYRTAGGDSSDPAIRRFAARYLAYLIIKGVSLLSFMTPDPDVYVSALTDADGSTVSFEGHPGGAFRKVLRWSFEKQGLYQPPSAPTPVTTAGEPPEVDVYIDDGRHGEYMPYDDNFQGMAEMWNRHAPDSGTLHEIPRIGVTNYAYVIVRNRGTAVATGVVVHAFHSKNPSATVWPTDWKPALIPRLTFGSAIAPGGLAVVGPFEWIPQFTGEALLISVSASGDISNLETVTAGPVPNAWLVPLDNNIAQRTFL